MARSNIQKISIIYIQKVIKKENNKEYLEKYLYDSNKRLKYKEDNNNNNCLELEYDLDNNLVKEISYNKNQISDKKVKEYLYEDDFIIEIGLIKDQNKEYKKRKLYKQKDSNLITKKESYNGLIKSYGYDYEKKILKEKSCEVEGINHKIIYNYQNDLLTSLRNNGIEIGYYYDRETRLLDIMILN